MPQDGRQSPAKFREKLGVYLTGVAIGFVLLGFFSYMKNQAKQNQAVTPQQDAPSQPDGSAP